MIAGQFELNGLAFGRGTAIQVNDFDPGARVVRDQDEPIPGAPGRQMGQDLDDGPEWLFELVVKAGTAQANLDLQEQLRQVWQAQDVATTPGALSVLRYGLPGRSRRVYGRPRRFVPPKNAVRYGWHHNYLPTLTTFQLADPLTYDDEAQSLDLGLVQSSSGALVLPAPLPWTLGRAQGQRQGEVLVGGQARVPFELTFYGPTTGYASSFWAQGDGWRVDLDAEVAFDQSVTVDTRAHTVTRSDGLSLAGAARGRFLAARMSPGAQEVAWGATDPTNTARMALSWRAGYHSL